MTLVFSELRNKKLLPLYIASRLFKQLFMAMKRGSFLYFFNFILFSRLPIGAVWNPYAKYPLMMKLYP